MPKTIDVFIFFNELDILEIRLNELDPAVDEFVLVEGTRTHQNDPKPLFFAENKQRFERFLPKMRHMVVDKWPNAFQRMIHRGTHYLENWQREYPLSYLNSLPRETNIIFSDIDEIPRASQVEANKGSGEIKIFEQRLYNFWFNNLCVHFDTGGRDLEAQKNKNGKAYWRGTVMVPRWRVQTLNKTRLFRDLQVGPVKIIEEGGWHFSYIGDVKRVKTKLEAYGHPEYNKSLEEIEDIMRAGRSIIPGDETRFQLEELDETYPKYLWENQEKFKDLIKW